MILIQILTCTDRRSNQFKFICFCKPTEQQKYLSDAASFTVIGETGCLLGAMDLKVRTPDA